MKKSGKKEISDIRLAVFLGNPGNQYKLTRHNLAWQFLDIISCNLNPSWQKKFKGTYAKDILPQNCIALRPETYMNRTAESVRGAADFFKFKPENIIVCHDDIELNFGETVLKKGGGSAGHNGLRSITQHLGSDSFYRFRLGISRPSRGEVSSHVLGKFTEDEAAALNSYLENAAKIFLTLFYDI